MSKFFKKHRHILILAALLAALALVCAWLAVSSVRAGASRSRTEILQDSGDAQLALSDGVPVSQTLTLQKDCFGFLLAFSTYGRTAAGTVDVALCAADGSPLAAASLDISRLKDGEFYPVSFAGRVPAGAEPVTLTVTAHPASAEDRLALLYSETPTDALGGLLSGGATQTGALYLQQITALSDANGTLYRVFAAVCALAAVALAGGYGLICVKKARLETVFVFLAAVLGLGFLLILPAGVSPDENFHIRTAYSQASVLLGQPWRDESSGALLQRACDTVELDDSSALSPFTYLQWAENWEWKAGDTTPTVISPYLYYNVKALPYLYAPATLAIALARMLGLGYLPLLVLGRLFTLAVYIVAVWGALRIAPVGKKILFAAALLPMSLSLAASYSYDTAVLELSFLFFAQVLAIAFADGPVRGRRWVFLALTGLLLAPAKNIYLLVLFTVFLIPLRRFRPGKSLSRAARTALFAAGGLAAAAVAVLGILLVKKYIVPSLAAPAVPLETQAAEAENIYVLPNYTVHYALTHLVDTVRLFLTTIQQKTGYYLKMMLGGFLAEPILVTVELSGLLTLFYAGLLGLSTLPAEGAALPGRRQRFVGLGVFLAVQAAVLAVCYLWTPYGDTTVWGVQGRYFLPALPAALFALTPRRIRLAGDGESLLEGGYLLAGIWCLLQLFTLILPLHA